MKVPRIFQPCESIRNGPFFQQRFARAKKVPKKAKGQDGSDKHVQIEDRSLLEIRKGIHAGDQLDQDDDEIREQRQNRQLQHPSGHMMSSTVDGPVL
jgi:hypothetical protein